MKQILQNLQTGETSVAEVPVPLAGAGKLLIKTHCSLVSVGTERMLVEFGKGNLLQKARQQPDKVRQVLDKIRTDGLAATVNAVRSKLDTPLPLGYCNVGTVVDVGAGVTGYRVGDRVVSNGKHAEYVSVPKNLCAKIPDGVADDAAVFTVISAIALQGIRLLQPTLGETIAVTGLGLIGIVAVQLLRAQGCRVLAMDFNPARLELARRFGAEIVDLSQGQDPVAHAQLYSRGRGVDGVLITASTRSNEPIHQAATMCRKRGRIVLVGMVGMEMSRADFYEKELSFQVSCSYGPGRYDPLYEEQGLDYPVGYVRWTEQRNFEAILDLLATGQLDCATLISHRFAIENAPAAYQLVSAGNPLGILIEYPHQAAAIPERKVEIQLQPRPASAATIGFIGAGNYAGSTLLPAFASTGAGLVGVACATGVSGVHLAKKFGIGYATTDTDSLVADPSINTLVISTRHDSHARWVCAGLRAGKHVFVEKPLALSRTELDEIERTHAAHPGQLLMVGFNRRYAPHIVATRQFLMSKPEPKNFVMTVNAGALPAGHWLADPRVGGGRIIGEGCHYIDLLRHMAGAAIIGVSAMGIGGGDSTTITLSFADGSIGTIHYFTNGNKALSKERLEVFVSGSVIQLDNFRTLDGFGCSGLKKQRLFRQDKGQRACTEAFVDAIGSGKADRLIPFSELKEVAQACLDAAAQLSR